MIEATRTQAAAQRPQPLQDGGAQGQVHTVQRGDSMASIAMRNGISLQSLVAANPQIRNPSLIFPGDKVTVPARGQAAPAATYTIRSGDTLSAIAQNKGTTLAALLAANPSIRNPNRIYPGTTIQLPGQAGGTGRTNGTAPTAPSAPAPAGQGSVAGIKPDAASVRAAAYAESHVLSRSTGYCYRYVKQALQATGATNIYLPGVAAKGAGLALEQQGFVNVLGKPGANIRSAYDAPAGAVLVYGPVAGATDKNAKYGHIEIRTNNGFASDYFSTRARTGPEANGLAGQGRVLIGVYIKPDPKAVQTAPTQKTDAAAPVGASGVNGSTLRLSAKDVVDLKKTLETEWVKSAGPQQAKGIIDTILNRYASGHWGNSISSVVNAYNQFSDVNGPVARRDHGRNSVEEIPMSMVSATTSNLVDSYLAERANGTPSSVGSHLNYANPYYSDAKNLAWINKLDGPVFGGGKAIHRHGTVPELDRYRPDAFNVKLP